MKMTVAEIATLVGGTVHGDGSKVIEGAAGLAEATESDISFLGNPKYSSQLATTRAGALLLSPEVPLNGRPAIVLKNPPYGWAKVLEILSQERIKHPTGIHPTALIHPTAQLGKNVTVGAYTVIEEGVVIGDNTILYAHVYVGHNTTLGTDCLVYPRVTFRERVSVGNRCIFQVGVVVGCDGFGFTPAQGRHYKIPQVGTVVIEDDVELQANTTIDRAAVGVTRIGRGTKVDNMVQIAHGVEIGEHCLIVAQTGIAGSTKIGPWATIAAQVGIAGHLTVGAKTVVGAKAGISHSIKEGEVVWGVPAHPLKDELRNQAILRRLPEILEEFKKLKKKVGL